MNKKTDSTTKTKEKKTSKKATAPEKTGEKKKVPSRANSGCFEKGHDKVGGRKAGSKNKYGNIRDRLKALLMPYLETDPDKMSDPKIPTLAKDLIKIDDPKDRAEVISKYLPFVVPKYSSTTITADADRPINEEEELLALDATYTKKEITLTLKQVTIVDNDKSSLPPPAPITDFDPDEEDDFDIDDIK